MAYVKKLSSGDVLDNFVSSESSKKFLNNIVFVFIFFFIISLVF